VKGKGKMTKRDLCAYRINYSRKDWGKYVQNGCCITLPAGILDAVEELCREVERLNGWRRGKEVDTEAMRRKLTGAQEI